MGDYGAGGDASERTEEDEREGGKAGEEVEDEGDDRAAGDGQQRATGGKKKRRGKKKGHGRSGQQPPVRPLPADMPKELRKYWNQRYRLFSRFDHGIR